MYHVRHARRIRHSFSGGGLGMENAHDSGEKASADLWEIKSNLWLVSPAYDTKSLSVWKSSLNGFLREFTIYCMWKSMRDRGYEERKSATRVCGSNANKSLS